MKLKPQSLTRCSVLAGLAFSAAAAIWSACSPVFASPLRPDEAASAKKAASDESSASSESVATASASDGTPRPDLSANQVFDAVTEKLNELDTLSCDISQTVILSGQRLVAAGKYMQAAGNRRRLEYRLFSVQPVTTDDVARLAVDAKPEDTTEAKMTASLLQVSDGSVLWSLWTNGDQKQLTRRNIRQIVEAANDIPNYSAAKSLQDLGVGGLQTLMAQLQAGMDFGMVREQERGGTKLLVLSGRWSTKALKEYFQLPDDPNAQLPDYIPDYVRVYIDADANLPRRIQYLKKHPNPEQKQVLPLVTIDLRNIALNTEIEEAVFTFRQPDGAALPEIDLTSQVIEGLKQIGAGANSATPTAPGAADETAPGTSGAQNADKVKPAE